MHEVDAVGLLAREVLRERTPALVAEACAWSVGLSDRPYLLRRGGRVVDSGVTLGVRAEAGHPLADEGEARLELGEAAPGTFADVLNALAPDGRVHAAAFDEQVLAPFVLDTCVRAAEQVRAARPVAWAELLEELGEDGDDLAEVVRAAEWEAPLRGDAEVLVLGALGHAPLVEVEAEGLPLALVRAAEAETSRAAAAHEPAAPPPDLEAARFLAEAAVAASGLPVPVGVADAPELLDVLQAEALEPDEVLALLPELPVEPEAAQVLADRVRRLREVQERWGA